MKRLQLFHYGRQLWRHAYGIIGLKRSDVWLASFPRSGNTWFRWIIGNVIHLTEGHESDTHFHELSDLSPELGFSNLHCAWPYTNVPRFIKTHHAYLPILFSKPAYTIHLIRDPRDVMVSYYNIAQMSKIIKFKGTLQQFIRDPKFGLPACIAHYHSWRTHATLTVKYEDMKQDTFSTFQHIFHILGVFIPDDILKNAIRLSAIDNMRKKEETTGIVDSQRFQAEFRAVRLGESNQWKSCFLKTDLDYYEQLCRQTNYGLYNQESCTQNYNNGN